MEKTSEFRRIMSFAVILLTYILSIASNADAGDSSPVRPVTYRYSETPGIGYEAGCTRRDPSDVVKAGDIYFVWYTKVIGRHSGYWGTVWYATSPDGFNWAEQGEALGLGASGAFDSQAVFTPNIIAADGKYYLFYTGVKPTPGRNDGVFENNSTTDITGIGVAVSDSPDGPFLRVQAEPVLEVSDESEDFDSYRVDDASLLYRNCKYWFYYKGRSRKHGPQGPRYTQMGVAFADRPQGPYMKHGAPILADSHEVLIWKCGTGVAALASFSSSIEYAPDGLDFTSDRLNLKVTDRPDAPGGYRPDLTGIQDADPDLRWGISMVHNGEECYLRRFDCIHESTNK